MSQEVYVAGPASLEECRSQNDTPWSFTTKLLIAIADYRMGIESGFPRCCVVAYVRDAYNGFMPSWKRYFEYPKEWRMGVGYVRCAKCITGGAK